MAKKDFSKTISGVDAFFTAATPAEEPINEEPKQPVAAPAVEVPVAEPVATISDNRTPARHGRSTYIFTLHLPKEWKDILSDTAWERRNSVTGLLVEIIGDWLKSHNKI